MRAIERRLRQLEGRLWVGRRLKMSNPDACASDSKPRASGVDCPQLARSDWPS